jgi:hypothetical protein
VQFAVDGRERRDDRVEPDAVTVASKKRFAVRGARGAVRGAGARLAVPGSRIAVRRAPTAGSRAWRPAAADVERHECDSAKPCRKE